MVSCVPHMMERSLSFKNWESDIPNIPNTPKNDAVSTIKSPVASPKSSIINRPVESSVSLCLPSQCPEMFLPASLIEYCSPKPKKELDAAATLVQKVFKSYRTRRCLADCAVVVEEFWWKALDFAALEHSSVGFFDVEKPQTAVSRWTRAKNRLAKVGKGLSKDENAQSLALRHWLEAIDPRHRYGHNLHFYYDVWSKSESTQPFFYWLDIGDGKEVNLEKIPRSRLQQQLITYLGPKERECYEVIVQDGKLVYKMAEALVHTTEGSKWIFVLSTSRSLYVGKKKKGQFQHSSFLAGAATTAAGRLVAEEGVIKAIWPYSGHYLPTQENFREFIIFLQEHNVDLTNVKRNAVDDDDYMSLASSNNDESETTGSEPEKSTIESTQTDERLENTMARELTRRISGKWSTGAGARIGCVRDYPAELQSRALEHVNLSPKVESSLNGFSGKGPIPSPRPSPGMRLSPRLHYMGMPIPSPRPSPHSRLSPQVQYMGIQSPKVCLSLPKRKMGLN